MAARTPKPAPELPLPVALTKFPTLKQWHSSPSRRDRLRELLKDDTLREAIALLLDCARPRRGIADPVASWHYGAGYSDAFRDLENLTVPPVKSPSGGEWEHITEFNMDNLNV